MNRHEPDPDFDAPRVSRRERVGAEVAHALARLIERYADPRLTLATVTEVTMSPDLKQARVWIASADPAADAGETLAALHHAGSRLRRELAGKVRLRSLPRLSFSWDHSGEERAHLETLIARGLPGERDPEPGMADSKNGSAGASATTSPARREAGRSAICKGQQK